MTIYCDCDCKACMLHEDEMYDKMVEVLKEAGGQLSVQIEQDAREVLSYLGEY